MIKSFYKKIYELLKYTTLFGRGQLMKYLEQETVPVCNSLLDLGCGSNSPISDFLQKYRIVLASIYLITLYR